MSDDTSIDLELAPVEEVAALGSGASFWHTKSGLGSPQLSMCDGPHGLRIQTGEHDPFGLNPSVPATCFPPAVGLGQSWNPELVAKVAAAIADEAQAAGVGLVLGPGINIKRDPRCGRNFEYYSEDPYLSGVLGAAWVQGAQDQGVGACVKHFAANNAEFERMTSSSDVDDRTLREIYLRAFERVIKTAAPWAVMSSYNRINGVYASENSWLLTELLRDEWGFGGTVISDWYAVVDRVAAVRAGLDLQMPGPSDNNDQAVVTAVAAGELDRADVNRAAERVRRLAQRASAEHRDDIVVDAKAHHALARSAAAQSIVLLKNDDDLLPLSPDATIAVIGEFASAPRYQGAGSSFVNATEVDIPWEQIQAAAAAGSVQYAQGFSTAEDADEDALVAEAVQAASAAQVAVVFLGLPASSESEGFDRTDLEIPAAQLRLLEAVLAVKDQTVVVLSHGGVVRLAGEVNRAPAILDGALLGQAGGGAIADVLFGVVNPSGRLTETVPVRLADVPSYLSFPGYNGHVRYAEGVFVGYRGYDARGIEVDYPFGHGLSYTTFKYADAAATTVDDTIEVSIRVTNTGARSGRETVQFYVAPPVGSSIERPVRELKAFGSVELEPGESGTVTQRITRRDLATWDTRADNWIVASGEYRVEVGSSSRNIKLTVSVDVVGDEARIPLTTDSTFATALAHPVVGPIIKATMSGMSSQVGSTESMGMDLMQIVAAMPLNRMASSGGMTPEQVQALLTAANRGLETSE